MIKAGMTFKNVQNGESMTVLQTAVDSNGELFAFENVTPTNTAGPPLHFHPVQEERFIVLEGTLHAQMDGQSRQFAAGETLIVPPGAIHTYDNRSDDDVRFRVELYPALDSDLLFAGLFSLSSKNPIGAILQLATLMHTLESHFYFSAVPVGVQKVLFTSLGIVGRTLGYKTPPFQPIKQKELQNYDSNK